MNPTVILGVLLSLSVLGNLSLGKLYVGAREDLAAEKKAFSTFKTSVRLEGEKAEEEKKRREMADKLAKDTADAENAVIRGKLATALQRLRDSRLRAGGSLVPPASPSSTRPDLAAFDRAEFDRALRGFEEGVERLVGEGAEAVVDLNTGKKWAAARP